MKLRAFSEVRVNVILGIAKKHRRVCLGILHPIGCRKEKTQRLGQGGWRHGPQLGVSPSQSRGVYCSLAFGQRNPMVQLQDSQEDPSYQV